MATFTASEAYAVPATHQGTSMVRSHLHYALSVSEIALMARIPNHAIITQIVFSGGTTGNTTGTWSLGFASSWGDPITGLSHSSNTIAAAISLTASSIWTWPTTGGTVNAPIQVSLTDGAVPQYVWVQCAPLGSVTATTTSSLRIMVTYRMPGG